MKSPIYAKIPATPGVYLMKSAKGEILYIGKAVNLKRRVSSYFQRSHDYRIEKLVGQIKKIDYKKTDTAIEALILESELIKKHQPPFNVLEKDDRSFLCVEITNEKFPRVLLVRGSDLTSNSSPPTSNIYGPFTSAASIREALKIIRRIFPYSLHDSSSKFQVSRSMACFDFSIGFCPGTCIGAISAREYAKTIRNIKLFFAGKKLQILKSLEKEMAFASKNLEFEKANLIKRQIFALKHIQDIAFINDSSVNDSSFMFHVSRIEGYDVSNISGTSAVGSMVVFINGKPDKSQYRKFKIRTIRGANDTGMIKEILARRLKHQEWPFPDLILIDGGRGQVNAVKSMLIENNLKIPVVGIAKGPKRNKNEFVGNFKSLHQIHDRRNSVVNEKKRISKKILVQVRDEAHRFAIQYHKKLRGVRSLVN